MPSRMKQQLQAYDPSNRVEGPFIVDVRNSDSEMRELYYCGHLPGAVNIPWRQITRLKMLSMLPKDREILIYSNNGQTGGQIAAILSIMGYDAVNLKWGITSWTTDETAAPERYSRKRDILWQNKAYRNTVTNNLEEEEYFSLPDNNTDGKTPSGIIWAAAEDYLCRHTPANASASFLYDPMFQIVHPLYVSPYEQEDKEFMVLPFGAKPGEHDEPFDWPYILDVRSIADFNVSHIAGCLHIPYKDVFKIENLKKLPPDRQIIVVSNTGHTSAHIAALLNTLGYDAINMKWGMSGWCHPEENNNNDYYSSERDCMDYPVVKGWIPGRATDCKS